ncbi:MAG: SusC/RagA family TonB-linked outer membrane protein [Prevotellaceae bacterium]|jgi:TonB-linked SusC/RagA family outer membrane protein|nr:SusC/RagA family TonB-linked outer membrane protein [Prevotellaceae bacterium]
MKKLVMIKKLFAVSVVLLCFAAAATAQNVVTGTVYDSDGKTALSGTYVSVKGNANIGTSADMDGKYIIRNIPDNAVLVFQFLGYKTQEIAVDRQSIINVTMESDVEQISASVVTALGITRDQKTLGYAVTKLDGADLTQTVESNWIDAMTGKIAGLEIQSGNTGPMGTRRVILRGEKSLSIGNNNVLYVVDGIVYGAKSTASGSGANYANADASVDFGNGLNDINPDDIESSSVLKGPAAAALYGSQAANGVIVITTKKGRKEKGIGVTVNSSVSFEKAGFWPDFQTEYGPSTDAINPYCFWDVPAEKASDGIAASRNSYQRYAFGEKFDSNKMRYLYASRDWENDIYTKLPFVYADNWYTGLFQTGVTLRNSISIDGNNGNGLSGRFSFTDTRNDWILPNTNSIQQVFAANMQMELNKYINLNTKVTYTRRYSDNVPISGYDPANVMYQLVWGYNVNDIDKSWKAEYFGGRYNETNLKAGNLVYPTTSDSWNPYQTLYEALNPMDRDRIVTSTTINIKINKYLEIDLRGSVDISNEFRQRQRPKLTPTYVNGYYSEQTIRDFDFNLDFMLKYRKKFFDDRLDINAYVGGIHFANKYFTTKGVVNALNQDRWYSLNNATLASPATITSYRSREKKNGIYALVSLGWKDTYFIDVTGRNDWSSTLYVDNWSYFYPSVTASILLHNTFNLKENLPVINFAKLRFAWANVGNATSPFNLVDQYSTTSFPGSYQLPGSSKNLMIRPENVENYEIGIETKLLQNRIAFNVSYYYTSTTDQIFSTPVDQVTGSTSMVINAGEVVDRGIEIEASFIPVKTKDFSWIINANWSKNNFIIKKMTDDWDPQQPYQSPTSTTIGSRTYIYSYVGEGDYWIYGRDYQKAPEGSYYIDENGKQVDCSGMKLITESTGNPVLDQNPTSRIAKVNPDWKAGMTQTFRYKNFSLGMTFAWQKGGSCYSVTNFSLSYIGKLSNSLEGRYDGMVLEGVNAITNPDGSVSYKKNTTVIDNVQNYYTNFKWIRDNTRENTFSTSYFKFKEARLDYTIPKQLCEKLKILQNASIGIFATNIFCITDFPQYDPETGVVNGTNIIRGIEPMTFPMTRTYGVNVKLQF